jgi:hypothetical protein
VALCQARISTKPLWGFSSSNPYPTQSRAEQLVSFGACLQFLIHWPHSLLSSTHLFLFFKTLLSNMLIRRG